MLGIYDEKSARTAYAQRLRDAEGERQAMRVAKANRRPSPGLVWLGNRLVTLGAYLQQIGRSLRASSAVSSR